MNYLLITYFVYIIVTLLLTLWVGRTLFVNGKVFLKEIFKNDELLVNSVNKLLLIGFYLINFGYVLFNLRERKGISTSVESIEILSEKIGLIVIILGIMHFVNLFVLFKLRKKAKRKNETIQEVKPPTDLVSE